MTAWDTGLSGPGAVGLAREARRDEVEVPVDAVPVVGHLPARIVTTTTRAMDSFEPPMPRTWPRNAAAVRAAVEASGDAARVEARANAPPVAPPVDPVIRRPGNTPQHTKTIFEKPNSSALSLSPNEKGTRGWRSVWIQRYIFNIKFACS